MNQNKIKTQLNECEKGNHSLIDVLRTQTGYDEEIVARWCQLCGAIVVDIDYDNRTNPGAVYELRATEVSKMVYDQMKKRG